MIPANLPYIIYVGLGNPGPKYEFSRHNMGFLVVQEFARKMGWQFKHDKRFNALITKGYVEGTIVHLLMPTTYMNLSGVALKHYLDFFKLDKDRVVVIVDDIALPFGQLRLRLQGSAGGHNGLKSIESSLGSSHYMRLRMGIGRSGDKILADYVLDPFNREEFETLNPFVSLGVEALELLLLESPTQVMNRFNKCAPTVGLGENTHESK